MYELLVVSHYPSINEKDIIRNVTIQIYLDDEINTSTIKDNNIVVTDNLYEPVAGTVGYDYTNKGTPSGIANILTFTPDTYLDPETTYNVFVNKYPDSVQSINDNYLQDTYKFIFMTGIDTAEITDPTNTEQLQADLEAAVKRGDWCEAARIAAILDKESSSCYVYPDPITLPQLPDNLILASHYPSNMQSDIPLKELRFIKLEFNDIMPISGIDYNSYITVSTKGVLE